MQQNHSNRATSKSDTCMIGTSFAPICSLHSLLINQTIVIKRHEIDTLAEQEHIFVSNKRNTPHIWYGIW